MQTKQKRRTRVGHLIVPVIVASFLAYFAIQAQSGRYGLEAKTEISELLEKRTLEHERIVKERMALEQRVQLLHDGTLERDMIDERARRALNLSTEDEITLLR